MSGEPTITICGSAGGNAELKFLPSGAAVCEWSMAVTPRVKQGDSWVDGETVWYRCAAWRQLGESAAESITKGMRLLVHGRLKPRTYETNGEKRVSLDVDVEHVAAEMRYATVKATKVERSSDAGSRAHGSSGTSSAPSEDPWGDVPPPGDSDAPPPF